MDRIRRNESHTVLILDKRFVTKSMATAKVREVGSNKVFKVKFNNMKHAEICMYDLDNKTLINIEGFWSDFQGNPEFTINYFEVRSKSKNSFIPSEQVEFIDFPVKKKASN